MSKYKVNFSKMLAEPASRGGASFRNIDGSGYCALGKIDQHTIQSGSFEKLKVELQIHSMGQIISLNDGCIPAPEHIRSLPFEIRHELALRMAVEAGIVAGTIELEDQDEFTEYLKTSKKEEVTV